MAHTLTLFPIASLLIIAYWFSYQTKAYYAFKAWFKKAWNRTVDFFCNICERIADDVELY